MTTPYHQAVEFLYSLRLFGTKLGLENTFRLATLAGNPQEKLRFIHVAGTNGKGSTCAMLESIYRVSGLKVGLFTSPHLVSFRERIQVDRQPISEACLVRHVDGLKAWLGEFPSSAHPTFFEVVTILALRYFVEQGCELVIWETGLGGRLDATNIVQPLASVITNIQLDHEKWLGSTLAQIAEEKAGIIKPGIPVLTAAREPEALQVIRQVAARNRSRLVEIEPAATSEPPLDRIRLPLLGEHQRLNAALALTTVRLLRETLPINEPAMALGLERVQWPGRLQLQVLAPGRSMLLDGAHNPAGAEALRNALDQHFPGARPTMILGILEDKDWQSMCRTLAPVCGRLLLAPVRSERTAHPAELEAVCRSAAPGLEIVSCANLAEAIQKAREAPLVVITGSIYFVGEALDILQLSACPAEERDLNEWSASPARQMEAAAVAG